MTETDPFERLRGSTPPTPAPAARKAALSAAMAAYDGVETKKSGATQGKRNDRRLTTVLTRLWSETMNANWKSAGPAIAGVLVVPLAAVLTLHLMNSASYRDAASLGAPGDAASVASPPPAGPKEDTIAESAPLPEPSVEMEMAEVDVSSALADQAAPAPARAAKPAAPSGPAVRMKMAPARQDAMVRSQEAPAAVGGAIRVSPIIDPPVMQEEDRDRIEQFATNPVKAVATDPVSTFSVDVDTASYAFTRRMLMQGVLPDADSVRVEEMINYFPYDWPQPESRETPFMSTVTVTPSPWNPNTKLMHVAIKGYDVAPAEKPRANLVFLIDVSGSMDEPDKLPLLKNAFRMLVNQLNPTDTVAIVTYAGEAGTVLKPTPASDRNAILAAIDTLSPGGSTAGAAGIEEAYRLAESAFIDGGVNRVMLATDGDFNVGPASDDELKRMIEQKRTRGVFLSVFGFGRGNLNDQLMQTLAQNGNGTAAYIDTLAEAQKALVEDASSTLFTIAKDVKIQVEFNPAAIAEYRLVGYETRALAREDFNNDRVDAGDIGSGHSVTAIYELTPVGSPAILNDPLRYGTGQPVADAEAGAPAGEATAGFDTREYAFVKIRYKEPTASTSRLITTPVTPDNEVASLDSAATDVRFATAVAAFGQKLRGTQAVDGFSWDAIGSLASGARGDDPYGYRSEFIRLVQLAKGLSR